jgi:hypothetical protein
MLACSFQHLGAKAHVPDRLNRQFYVKDMHTTFSGQSAEMKKIVLYASISFHAH